jgi:hypothetical protein
MTLKHKNQTLITIVVNLFSIIATKSTQVDHKPFCSRKIEGNQIGWLQKW